MGVNLLREIMEKRFHEIKNNFKRASARHNLVFDDDIFIDTYIKCSEFLINKKMTEEQVIQYFWTAFVNNIKKTYRKSKYKLVKIELEENGNLIPEINDIIDEPYDDRRYRIFDTIIENIKQKFSEDEYNAWYLHFVENKTYEELNKLNYNMNFHNVFRNINNYIKIKLPKENQEYKMLIDDVFKKKA